MLATRLSVIILGVLANSAAQATTAAIAPADANFRRVTASGGALGAVDLTNAFVRQNGANVAMASVLQRLSLTEPAAMANLPGGWLQLGADGLVPSARLPAAFSAAAAIQLASLGQANGPAALDAGGTLSGNTVKAYGATVARSLAARFSDTINAADRGMMCDGSTDDTAALTATIQAAGSGSRPMEVDLPSGTCMLSGPISISATQSINLPGRGQSVTSLVWTTANDGIVVSLGNGAGLIAHDFTIKKTQGANGSQGPFIGRALFVKPSGAQGNMGQVVIANVTVQPWAPAAQTDGWAVGIGLQSTNNAILFNDAVSAPYFPNAQLTGTVPTPTNGSADPAAAGLGIADDVLLLGDQSTFSIDTAVIGLSLAGGLAGIDVGNAQGVYAVDNKIVASSYGIRGIPVQGGVSGLDELLTATGNHFNSSQAGIYLNGLNDVTIQGNFFLHFGHNPSWASVWLRNTGANTVTGNSIVGNGNDDAAPSYGIYLSSDQAGGFAGFPNSITGNTLLSINGACLGNDAHVTGIIAVGNAMQNCSTYITDGTQSAAVDGFGITRQFGSNAYVASSTNAPGQSGGYPSVIEDLSGDLKIRRGLFLGGPYDASFIDMMSGGTSTFLVSSNGSVSANGVVNANGGIVSPTATVTGVSRVGAAAGHQTAEFALWYYGVNTIILTRDGTVPTLGNSLLPLPNAASEGRAIVAGDASCWNGTTTRTWHFTGTWRYLPPGGSGKGTLSLLSFASTLSDGAPADGSGVTLQGGTDTTNLVPQVQVVAGGSNVDCSAHVFETMVQ